MLQASSETAAAIRKALATSPLTEDQQILHVLNRLGYGPRPGDVERLRRMGIAAYIDQQLHPERIMDSSLDRRLATLPTLSMTTRQLLAEFPRPDIAAARPVPAGQEPGPRHVPPSGNGAHAQDVGPVPRTGRQAQGMTREQLLAMFPPEKRPQRIIQELQAAKTLRAVYSERQLAEIMADFWFNHFNVYAGKGADRWLLTSYDRDVIRPRLFGKFRDLLVATAKSPAMLFYLDNWQSVAARTETAMVQSAGNRRRGLNENYARELMELHTLGVDGGYTQRDVTEVARCFTGWTIGRPREEAEFVFRRAAHDDGQKVVLGHRIPAGGGIADGERVIEILVRHPSTARFLATKLVRRFVADQPPGPLVERVAEVYLRTDGDIRAMVWTIVTSAEFFSAEAYRAKIKKPSEMVASALRALGAETEAPPPLHGAVARMGEPLFEAQPPTGYPDVAEAWVNTGALLTRMNFSLALASNRIPGTTVDLARFLHGADPTRPEEIMDHLLGVILHGEVTPATRAVLARHLTDPEILRATLDDRTIRTDAQKLAALILGSPEFQRK